MVPPGYYLEKVVCPAGKFCTGGFNTPQPCPADAFCPVGASSPNPCSENTTPSIDSSYCMAKPGYYKNIMQEVFLCNEDFYCPGDIESSQKPCPPDTTSRAGATSERDCTPKFGFYMNNGIMTKCPAECMITSSADGAIQQDHSAPIPFFPDFITGVELSRRNLVSINSM